MSLVLQKEFVSYVFLLNVASILLWIKIITLIQIFSISNYTKLIIKLKTIVSMKYILSALQLIPEYTGSGITNN